jgi:predicted nucleic acid-binding protein
VPFTAVIDACVLVNAALRDTILRAAESEQFGLRIAFSEDILDEVHRTLTGALGIPVQSADRLVDTIRDAFDDALVEGYEALIPAMTNHPKDRHVLAAAVRTRGSVIVTANLSHFKSEACDPYDIEVRSPDDFLLTLWNINPIAMAALLKDQAADLHSPPMTTEELLTRLAQDAPRCIGAIRTSGAL